MAVTTSVIIPLTNHSHHINVVVVFCGIIMFTSLNLQRSSAAFLSRRSAVATRSISTSFLRLAEEGQAEVILVGCGAPNRGMGWYHAIQMLEKK